MSVRRILSIAIGQLIMTGGAHADRLVVGDVQLQTGQTRQVAIMLDNTEAAYAAFQFDLVLPSGFSIAKDEGNQPIATLNAERMADHVLNVAETEPGTWRFMAYSPSNQPLADNDGPLLFVTLQAEQTLGRTKKTASLQAQVFTEADGTQHKWSYTAFAIATDTHSARLAAVDVATMRGMKQQVIISLDNAEVEAAALQFDLQLPTGFSIRENRQGELEASLDDSRKADHQLNVGKKGEGLYRFLIFSMTNAPFKGNSGGVVRLTLKTDRDVAEGIYTGTLRTVTITASDGEQYKQQNTSFFITVKPRGEQVLALDLNEGWNWISVNFADAVQLDAKSFLQPIQEETERLLSHTQELVYDPDYGLVGNLATLDVASGYRIKVSEDVTGIWERTACIPSETTISLKQGWNWLGYTPTKALAVELALSGLQASDGDRIVSQDGFAEYQDGAWNSSFGSMEPGKGYMYCSAKDVEFCYPADNATARATDKGMRAAEQQPECPWEYDVHRYPDVTTIISLLQPLQKESLPQPLQKEGGNIAVAAFCGEECRGVGRWVGDKLFITVHGTNGQNEAISFSAYDSSTGEVLPIIETINFQGQSVGSLGSPMLLHVQEANGIEERHSETVANRYYAPSGRKLQRPQKGVNIIVAGDGSTRKIVAK